MGLLLHEKPERYDEAESAFRKAIELDPSLESPYLNLGQLYLDLGKHDKAIQIFSEAVSFNHAFSRCYRMRGLVYQTRGELEAALKDYRQALELQPDYGSARMSLFGLLTKMGKTTEAGEHEELARSFAEDASEYNRACFESLCGNDEEALDLLEASLEKGRPSKDWARQDPDLENLWDDPRFKILVGE